MGATARDYGLLTTPQLHHIVRMANSTGADAAKWASEEGYYTMLSEAYADILQVHFHRSAQQRLFLIYYKFRRCPLSSVYYYDTIGGRAFPRQPGQGRLRRCTWYWRPEAAAFGTAHDEVSAHGNPKRS